MGDVPPKEVIDLLRRLWLEGKFPKPPKKQGA